MLLSTYFDISFVCHTELSQNLSTEWKKLQMSLFLNKEHFYSKWFEEHFLLKNERYII